MVAPFELISWLIYSGGVQFGFTCTSLQCHFLGVWVNCRGNEAKLRRKLTHMFCFLHPLE